MSSPSCPVAELDCSKRLLLRECLERWHKEPTRGVLDTGRYRCRYVVWGSGPTLVLVPGMAMDAEAFVMPMARLQAHFRCVSFALPDGDQDGARIRSYRHDDLVSDLFALLDHLAIQRCDIFGSSFGSTITLSAVNRQPARFGRVILQGGFARRPLSRAEVLAASFARFLPGRMRHLPFVTRVLENNARPEFRSREPEVWDYFVEQNLRIPLRAFAMRALLIHRVDLRPILPSIAHPVLLICGDRDRLIGRSCEAELKQGLPHAARAEIEGCAHLPQLTHPEVLCEVVRQYLVSGEL